MNLVQIEKDDGYSKLYRIRTRITRSFLLRLWYTNIGAHYVYSKFSKKNNRNDVSDEINGTG